MFNLVEKKSLADAVFEQLRDRIISGQLEVGETLVGERELCKAFGVNRGLCGRRSSDSRSVVWFASIRAAPRGSSTIEKPEP